MKPDVVVDVGNTRIKWGRCTEQGVVETVSLPSGERLAWQEQWAKWGLSDASKWAIASVNPRQSDGFLAWLNEKEVQIWVAKDPAQLPLQVDVKHPDRVGIDRLLNAVAAVRTKPRHPGPAIVVDAGSAVTVDLVDEAGRFRGGTIFPGLGLMAKALHDYTALLPLVDPTKDVSLPPGRSTEQAIKGGVFFAVAGGIKMLIDLYANNFCQSREPLIYLTGGDGPLLMSTLVGTRAELWPEMTLDGLRITAEAQL